jgi:hypothetical protein
VAFGSLFLSALVFAQQPCASPQVRAKAIVEEALDDKNPDTRKLAVIALSLASSREPFLSWLESKLEEKDVEVRIAADGPFRREAYKRLHSTFH